MRPDFTQSTSTTAGSSSERDPASKPGAEKRRRLEPAEARDAILFAAETLLVRNGPESLRLTEIAARAGVSHPNVLYHFGSVGELQSQLAQRVAVRLASEVARAFASESGASGGATPIDDAVKAVFHVFKEGGYARLIAWLALSTNEPTFEALGATLEGVRVAIAEHPVLGGAEHAAQRSRVIPAIELVIVAALGYGLSGATFDGLFAPDEQRPDVPGLLAELLTATSPELMRSPST
jgi:AcrR family transcriptional regulator